MIWYLGIWCLIWFISVFDNKNRIKKTCFVQRFFSHVQVTSEKGTTRGALLPASEIEVGLISVESWKTDDAATIDGKLNASTQMFDLWCDTASAASSLLLQLELLRVLQYIYICVCTHKYRYIHICIYTYYILVLPVHYPMYSATTHSQRA